MSRRLGTLVSAIILMVTFPLDGAPQDGVEVKRDIHFATIDGVELLLNLHLPAGVERPPLMLFIHGGGWKNGDRNRCRLAWVARHGYAVASIEYRLSHEAIFPAQIHDCKGALRWLRGNQNTYGFDATRVVVAGTSAGGHLAALMGTSGAVDELEGKSGGYPEQSSRVQGVIDYYGPSDFILRSEHHPAKTDQPSGSVYQLVGGPVKETQVLARLASPVHHVSKDDPPLLILHGDKDRTVQLRQSEHLANLYRERGLDVILHVEPGKGHGWNPPSDAERKQVLEFLQRHLGAKSRVSPASPGNHASTNGSVETPIQPVESVQRKPEK